MKAPRCRTCGVEHRLGPCPDTMTKRERNPFEDAARGRGTETKLASSSAVERGTVNASVAGSNPASSAKPKKAKKRVTKSKPSKRAKKRRAKRVGPRPPIPPGGLHPRVGRPKPEDRDSTLAAVQPWLDLEPPVSRATYFRRKRRDGPGANAWGYTPRKKAAQ
jgi:hypothetical protein